MSYNIIKAREEHLDELILLLFDTGYYKQAAVNNKLNLSSAEFHKEQTLKPFLKHTYILTNDKDVMGFYIAVTKKELNEINQSIQNWYYDDKDLMSVIKKIESYYNQESTENELIALNAAIHPKYRDQHFYQLIKNHRDELARKQKCTRIIFVVWRSNPAHIIFKEHYGAEYLGVIDCKFLSIHDQLLKGIFTVE